MSRTIIDTNIAPGQAFKNRIINGDMRIDQRNVGAVVTVNDAIQFFVADRWLGLGQLTDGVFTLRTNNSGLAEFPTCLTAQVTTADASLTTTQLYYIMQRIEGNMTADFLFGTASAKQISISFWVKSSIAGSYSVIITNDSGNRTYPSAYTINSANVWERKTIAIPGDTTGTWPTSNLVGSTVIFPLGVGPTYTGSSNSWQASIYGITGQTMLIGTLNANFNVTAVQLEIGSVSTPFEYRPLAQELIMCQRYYEKNYDQATVPGATSVISGIIYSRATAGTHIQTISFKVTKRAPPTVAVYNGVTGSSGSWRDYSASTNLTATANDISDSACWIGIASAVAGNGTGGYYVAKSEI